MGGRTQKLSAMPPTANLPKRLPSRQRMSTKIPKVDYDKRARISWTSAQLRRTMHELRQKNGWKGNSEISKKDYDFLYPCARAICKRNANAQFVEEKRLRRERISDYVSRGKKKDEEKPATGNPVVWGGVEYESDDSVVWGGVEYESDDCVGWRGVEYD